ncbi:MAG: 3'-5' exonuclease [Parabacteroides sp.]|nr:3'-5' exonuclease [Parabacteroides sp.]
MRLFLAETCWDKLFDLPKRVQTKVKEFQRKFRENSISAAIHLEPIAQFKDSSLRTARIGDDYRAILGVISADDYSLLYVDHHDEAMRWASNKKFVWNEHTQSCQIIPLHVDQQIVDIPKEAHQEIEKPFMCYGADKLLKIGVPTELIPLVCKFEDMTDLEKSEALLPVDTFEYLFYILDGERDIDQIIIEIEEGKSISESISEQLLSNNNKRRFVEIKEDEDLDRLLDGDIKKWQIFLHPSQRKLVESEYKGSMKVSGGGGTGKTVAAIHRLKKLTASPVSKVLFTTFTKALTQNLEQILIGMDLPSGRYDLNNIDAVIFEIAKTYTILPENFKVVDYLSENKGVEMWTQIVDDSLTEFDADFLYSEYLEVIVFNNIVNSDTYLKQSRIGRTKSLSRKQRMEIWTLAEKYKEEKAKYNYVDRSELFNIVANYLNSMKIHPYTHVIADEIQDFSNPELRFLRALVAEGPNDLFLVGDPFQRIYNNRRINFSLTGINIRGVRSKRLRVNYRTTEEIKKVAVSVVKGCSYDDFEGNSESITGYVSLMHGEYPAYLLFDNLQKELDAIVAFIEDCLLKGVSLSEIAVTAKDKDALKQVQSVLHNKNIHYRINRGKEWVGDLDGVRLCTFHSIKGLEFKVVILTNVNDRTMPVNPESYLLARMDRLAQKNYLLTLRSLLYVAITRAQQKVLITGVGKKTEILQGL